MSQTSLYTTLLCLSILPVIVLLVYIYHNDKYEKEPLGMLVKALLFGSLSVIPAIFMEQAMEQLNVYNNTPVVGGIFEGFCVAGFCEELCKLALLWLCVWHNRNFNEYFDGIVYASCVALGFAGIENIGYVFSSSDFSSAFHTGVTRAILSVPAHFLFGVVMGYYFALAKFNKRQRLLNIFLAFLIPMLLHGTFDSLLMIPEKMGEGAETVSSLLFIIFIWFDIRLWKIGRNRLTILQKKTEEQARAYNNENNYNNTSKKSQSNDNPFNWHVPHDDSRNDTSNDKNKDENDSFKGIDWDV